MNVSLPFVTGGFDARAALFLCKGAFKAAPGPKPAHQFQSVPSVKRATGR